MRFLIMLSMLFLICGVSLAQQAVGQEPSTESSVNQQLNHKIKMISHILGSSALTDKLQLSDNANARQLITRARENYGKIEAYMSHQQYLEASAVIDFVLRDLSASAQLLSLEDRQMKNFQRSVEKFEAFVLPDWKVMTGEEQGFLQKTLDRIGEFESFAIENAEAENYIEATKLMETAYYLKTTLIEKLPHESDVIYDLKFSSVEDEYEYMTNRAYHFMELVDLAISKNKPDAQTRKLADKYISRSMIHLEDAKNLELGGKYSEAITVLGKSIEKLSTVLRLMGIKI